MENNFDKKVISIAKDLSYLYKYIGKDIDAYDVIEPPKDLDNIEFEFINSIYEALVDKNTRINITEQLEEYTIFARNIKAKQKVFSMLKRIGNIGNIQQDIPKNDKINEASFNEGQLYQINKLIEYKKETNRDIDIRVLSNPNLNYGQMGELRRSFESGLTNEQVKIIANPEIPKANMVQLKEMFLDGMKIKDVSNFASASFSFQHLWICRDIFRKVKDISLIPKKEKIFDCNISSKELLDIQAELGSESGKKGIMAKINEMKKNKEVTPSSNPSDKQKQNYRER